MPEKTAIVPLRDFWSSFFEVTSRDNPPLREAGTLQRYLVGVFGELTDHAFEHLEVLPTRVTCEGCRNNTVGRRDAVCETHLGVLTGLFRAMTHAPVNASYTPDPEGNCVITLQLIAVNGTSLTALAARLQHVEPFASAGQPMLLDRRNGAVHALVPSANAVMSGLDQERTPSELAAVTGLGDAEIRIILDQFYAAGWVSCRFALVE
ncbi:hypothetical protein [Rhizobium johnstonii]|uniref:hypothetical protein n=1 Tax=Rhizobium johnstonii TaxID=3019933 RepID=UPI003F9C8E17